jgi:hypothetical protein
MAISIAAPHSVHWGFSKVRKINPGICRTWVADCGDPYVGVTIDTFKKPFYFAWIEKDFCSRADFITIPIESARTAYFPEFHDKIRVVPQGLKLPELGTMPKYEPHEIPTFVYSGGFLPGVRDPRPLLEHLCSIDRPFRFTCYTMQKEMLSDFERRLAGRLVVLPYIPRDQMIKELAKADFLLNLENGTDRQTPSKLIDYSIACRPILSLNSQKLDLELLGRFLDGDYSGKAIVPVPSTFDIRKIAADFEQLHTSRFH